MNLLRALATVSSMTMLSRILGFVRDFVIARTFGAGVATDAFFVAFKLPNLLRRMFAEGAFSQAFVPILGEYKNRQGADAAHALVNRVAGTLGLCVLLLSIVGVLAAPWLVYLSAPGFSANAGKFELTVALTRLTFPYILFMSLVALAGGVLNTWGRFAIPAFTPVLLNLSFIALALWLAPQLAEPVMALGWAVILGGFAQLALQLPALAKLGMLPRPQIAWRDEGVRRVMRLMAPALLGVSVTQISLLINTVFASFLQTGSVSWLYYADRLMEFPVGLLGAALGTILLPTLSRLSAEARHDEYSQTLDWGLRLCLLLALPAALALAILSAPLIATLFYHGAFAATDVFQTQRALIAYAVGLTGLLLVKVLAPGFYARQNIRTPVKIALASLAVTQLLNLALIVPLQHAGLALAIGLAACFNAGFLYRGLRRHGIYQPQAGWSTFALRLAAGLAVMGAALWFFSGDAESWLHYPPIERLWRLGALVCGGAAVYFGALRVVGIRLADFRRRADY